MITIITGHDAIAHAARTGAPLHKHADPTEGARAITLDEAREIAREDAGLVWCEAHAQGVAWAAAQERAAKVTAWRVARRALRGRGEVGA